MKYIDLALIFKALGDNNRLEIVKKLAKEELCACVLLRDIDISQPTLSHHMRVLTDCGLVTIRKEGKWSHYSINDEYLEALKEFIEDLGA